MIDHRTIATPSSRYGDAKHATGHFKLQRLTGALNIVFTLFLIWFVLTMAGAADAAARIATIRNPFVAIALILLIVNVAAHMRIGMQEVIDDYVDQGSTYNLAKTANVAFAGLVVLLVIGSVIKILFWG